MELKEACDRDMLGIYNTILKRKSLLKDILNDNNLNDRARNEYNNKLINHIIEQGNRELIKELIINTKVFTKDKYMSICFELLKNNQEYFCYFKKYSCEFKYKAIENNPELVRYGKNLTVNMYVKAIVRDDKLISAVPGKFKDKVKRILK